MSKKKDKKPPPQKKKEGSGFRTYKGSCLIIFLASFLLFSNTLSHEYAFDDSVAITANDFTKEGVGGIKDLMTKDLFAGTYGQGLEIGGGRWRPLSLVTFAIEWQLNDGPNPGMSHFINVTLFAVSMVLLFLVLVRILEMPVLSFLVTLLFVVHPLHSEVVANIKSRDEIFSLLFILATLWFLFSPNEKDRKKNVIKGVICYGLALLSKENGIMFLLLFPFMLMVFRMQKIKDALKKCVPLFLIAGIYLVIRATLVGSVGDKASADIMENHFFGLSFADRTATVAYIFLQYVRLLFYPHPLSSDYSFNQTPIVGWSDPFALLSLILHLALFYFSFRVLKKHFTEKTGTIPFPVIMAFGFLYYIIHISLISNLLFNIGAPLGERFTYLASLGFCLALVAGLFMLLSGSAMSKITLTSKPAIFTLVICLPLAFKTFSRNFDWKNNETLFSADVTHAPNSAKVHFYLGNSLFNNAQNDKENPQRPEILNRAKSSISKAVTINPRFHHAWNKLGMIYEELLVPDSAIYCFEKAVANNPENVNLTAEQKGKTKSLDKTSVDALASLGSIYGKQKGDFDKAIYYINQSLTYNPNNVAALQNLGIAYAMKGATLDAIRTFEKALQLDPNNGTTYTNLGKLYGNAGDMKKAEEYFAKARSLGVDPGQLPK